MDIKPQNIVALPIGLIAQVVSINGDIIKCRFIQSPIEKDYNARDVRYIADKPKPPLSVEDNFKALINQRHLIVADYLASFRKKKRKTGAVKRKKSAPSMMEEIANAKPEEVRGILDKYGIPYSITDKED